MMTPMWWFSALCSPLIYHAPCSWNAEQRIELDTLTSTSFATAWKMVYVILWLVCPHTSYVKPWVHSQVVGTSERWSKWYHSIVRKCFASWGSPGSHPWTYWRNFKHSHANCTHHPRQQWTSTHPATSFLRITWGALIYPASTMRWLALPAYHAP